MHDAGAVLALHGAQMVNATVIDQGVRKGAALVAMGGMAHQTALLGEHDEVVVLVADIEGMASGITSVGSCGSGKSTEIRSPERTAYFLTGMSRR